MDSPPGLSLIRHAKGNHTQNPAIDSAVNYQMNAISISEVADAVWKPEIDVPGLTFAQRHSLVINKEFNNLDR